MKDKQERPAGEEGAPPSKSQVKRELKALQRLGERLAALPLARCRKLPLGEETLEALEILARIRPHGARRRQLRLLGKRLREEDASAIEAALEALDRPRRQAVALEHAAEEWRGRLLHPQEGAAALSRFIETYPEVDRSRLRQLVRGAQAEAGQEGGPTRQRRLFRYLREILEASQPGEFCSMRAILETGHSTSQAKMKTGKQRPVFLDLMRIRMPIGAVVSFGHRLSGVFLFALIPLGLWMLDRSLASPEGFDGIRHWLGGAFFQGLALVLGWALLHHLLSGLRFLALDVHWGVQREQARRSAWAVLVAGFLLGVLVGVAL